MMGFGLSPGDVPAPRVVPPFQALDIDVAERDVSIDAKGFYKSIHPVDHKVILTLLIALGVVPADPSIGTTLLQVPFDTDEYMTADGSRRVQNALNKMVLNQDITIDQVQLLNGGSVPGRLIFEIEYQNLRLPEGERMRKMIFETPE
jgi:hypothetical protein